MKTENNQPGNAPGNDKKIVRKKRINQLIYIEYENPKPDGHKITAMDSYRNVLGRIHEKYDEQTGKFEYTFCDNEGKLMFKSEQLQQLKQEISRHKTVMMEQAHQRRIDRNLTKSVSPYSPFKKAKREKTIPRKSTSKEIETFVQKVSDESREVLQTVHEFAGGVGKQSTREQELKKLRKEKEQDRDQEISR